MKVTHNAPLNPHVIDRTKGAEKANKASDRVTVGAEKAVAPAGSSVIDISEDAQLMRKAAEIAMSAPDIRSDKVENLKKLVREGKYHIDSEAVAERLLQEHLNTDFGKNNL